MGYAEAIVIEYNSKRKNPSSRLSIERLHNREHPMFTDIDEPDEKPKAEPPTAELPAEPPEYEDDDDLLRYAYSYVLPAGYVPGE